MGAIRGSNAEHSQCRRKAFAYQTRFGQLTLFVTLTPNADNSFVLAQYTGVSSVLDARMPTKAELREASRGNDCASARLFMRQVDYVLEVDPATKKSTPHGGLFGTVQTYFGMVETQGRGTLHIHFLIWLKACPPPPPNSAADEKKLLRSAERDQFRLTPSETTDFLARANDHRMGFCKSDDDPFQNDYLTRLIEMLPPPDCGMADQSRILSETYSVEATLVVFARKVDCHLLSWWSRLVEEILR
ncbi:Helitron helicase-like domain [Phytophthora cactorum]|nr:Helitron helicase-like domain [Phytophthora cactorum]